MSSLGHKVLVSHCVTLLDTFDPTLHAAEQHVEAYLQHQQGLETSEETFISEVFSGCIRYTSVLNVVTTGFFNRDGKTVLRSAENLYKVFCYLALFRLDELGISHYMRFVRSQDVNKMHRFLSFLFNEKHLHTWMKDEWNKLYENTFVQMTLMSPLLRWLPELQEMTQQMKKKLDNKVKPKKPTIAATEIKPFQLTQPRPRSVPMPDPIPVLQPHREVPSSTYKEPQEQDFITKVKETNRRKAEERLMEASRSQYACANPEKSEKTKQKINDILDSKLSQLDFEKHKSNPVPRAMLSENIPIKLNAAAILREGKLYKKREEIELRKLENLEAGASDGSEFAQWQEKMRRADTDRKLALIEQRRLEGKLSHEDAILARQNLTHQNRRKVEDMKKEAEELMQLYMEKKLLEDAEARKLVEEVLDTHENAKEAKRKLQEFKASVVQQVTEESRELMRQALEEAEIEMQKKMDLIREIRAMEAVPVNRFKLVDFSEKAGHGLLSEMSIAELRERLCLMDQRQKEEEEATRDDILAAKEAKDQLLMDTLQTISRHRTEQSKAAAIRFEQRKKTRNAKPEFQDEKILDLQRKLEERKELRKKEQDSAKMRPDPKSLKRLKELNATKKLVEENRWKELEKTRERTARLGSQGILGSQSASRIAGRSLLMST